MTLDDFERYLGEYGDLTPVYYLLDKYARDPGVAREEALDRLAALAEALPALLAAAGVGTKRR